jgi:hypothetical protein
MIVTENELADKKILKVVFWQNNFVIKTNKGIFVIRAVQPSVWSDNHYFIIEEQQLGQLEPGILMELGSITPDEYQDEMNKIHLAKAQDDIEYYKHHYPQLFNNQFNNEETNF